VQAARTAGSGAVTEAVQVARDINGREVLAALRVHREPRPQAGWYLWSCWLRRAMPRRNKQEGLRADENAESQRMPLLALTVALLRRGKIRRSQSNCGHIAAVYWITSSAVAGTATGAA
jgi:hypothetical protein